MPVLESSIASNRGDRHGLASAACGRFPGSRRIIDDGWSVEFGLSRDDVQGLLGADALECRVIVEPWSSFARRPESDRFVYDDGCGLADWLS